MLLAKPRTPWWHEPDPAGPSWVEELAGEIEHRLTTCEVREGVIECVAGTKECATRLGVGEIFFLDPETELHDGSPMCTACATELADNKAQDEIEARLDGGH